MEEGKGEEEKRRRGERVKGRKGEVNATTPCQLRETPCSPW
jgi:hypothetical protein